MSSDFTLSIAFGLCFGFLFGIGCSLAVMYSIYQGGYRKAVADSLEPAKPKRFKLALEKVQAKRAREDAPRLK